MSGLLPVIVAAFGGSAAALAVAAFLGRSLVEQWLARRLEAFKARLEQAARDDDRRFDLAQVMRRYQGPLLHAVNDLQSRCFNILDRGFFTQYLVRGSAAQQHYALHNTAFLIAQFFGWTEIVRQEVQFIEFADDARTRRLAALRDTIYGLWQSNRFSDALWIWAGEQRAIGELMIERDGAHRVCIGYARFLKAFAPGREPLIDRLRDALLAGAEAPGARERLLAVQHALIDMLDLLDPDALRFPPARRTRA